LPERGIGVKGPRTGVEKGRTSPKEGGGPIRPSCTVEREKGWSGRQPEGEGRLGNKSRAAKDGIGGTTVDSKELSLDSATGKIKLGQV